MSNDPLRPTPEPSGGATAGSFPNLLIIGAAKSGTTSLHRYLDEHPSIFMSTSKELQFFSRDDWKERLDWYRSQFSTQAQVRGESSPAYSMDPWLPCVPERIHRVVPEALLIYLVRDPIERLIAQYVEFFANYLEHRSFEEALADYDSPSNAIVMSSRYSYQLDRYREFFADSQILVLDQRDLLKSRQPTLRSVFEFLGVDPEFTAPGFEVLHNRREKKMRPNASGRWLHERGVLQWTRETTRVFPYRLRERLKLFVAEPVNTPVLPPSLRSEIEDYLREDVERLRLYTGKTFDHWTV